MKKKAIGFLTAAFLCLSVTPDVKASDELEMVKNDILDYWSNFVVEIESYCQANDITNANLQELCFQIPHQKASFYQRRLEQATCLNQLIVITTQIKVISEEFAASVEDNQSSSSE
jgi:hypothetical protein